MTIMIGKKTAPISPKNSLAPGESSSNVIWEPAREAKPRRSAKLPLERGFLFQKALCAEEIASGGEVFLIIKST